MKFAKNMITIVSFFLVVSCSTNGKDSVIKQNESITMAKVDTIWVPLQWRNSRDEDRNYSFEFEGIVESVFVAPGKLVKAGEKIASLRSSELYSRIASQKIVLNAAERELKRVQQLYEQQARTAVQSESVQVVVSTAREQFKLYGNELKNRTIYAQKSGVVMSVNKKSAEYAVKGSTVAVVDESDSQDKICVLPYLFETFLQEPVTLKIIDGNTKGTAVVARVHQTDSVAQLHFKNSAKRNSGVCLLPILGNVAKLSGVVLQTGEIVEVLAGKSAAFALVVKSSGSDAWVVLMDNTIKPGSIDRVIR